MSPTARFLSAAVTTLDHTTLHLGAEGSQGTLSVLQGTTLTLGPDLTLDVTAGQISAAGALDNEGSISVVDSGAALNIVMEQGAFTNAETGTITFGAQGAANFIQANNGGGFYNKGNIVVENGDTLSLFVSGHDFNSSGLNDGNISVGTDGHLIIGGQLGGSGSIIIGADGTLELFSGSLSNGVSFAEDAVGTLRLDVSNGVDFHRHAVRTGAGRYHRFRRRRDHRVLLGDASLTSRSTRENGHHRHRWNAT